MTLLVPLCILHIIVINVTHASKSIHTLHKTALQSHDWNHCPTIGLIHLIHRLIVHRSIMSALLKRFKTLTNRLSSISLPKRLRGGSIERSLDYLKQVKDDYKQVLIDTRNECRDRPLKASAYGSVLAFVGYCMATNPDENDFRHQLIESHNNLCSVPKNLQNPTSCDFLLTISDLQNQKVLNYQSLGLFSVIYVTDWPKHCALFQNNCKYLKPKISSYFYDRILDIGFIKKFRILDNKMIDYDVNDQLFHTNWPFNLWPINE